MQLRIPVDQPLVAIDQPVLVELDEHPADRLRQTVVHGEALAAPVAGRAEPAQLAGDGAARFRLPLPDPPDEGVATEIVARLALRRELALHHHLGGDAGVVGARLPQRVAPPHARETDQDVLQRVVERMPHMQAAGDVGGRDHDRIGRGTGVRPAGAAAGEGARLLPARVDAVFDVGGPIGLVHFRLGTVQEIRMPLNPRRRTLRGAPGARSRAGPGVRRSPGGWRRASP